MNSGSRPKPSPPPQHLTGPAGFAKAIRGLAKIPKKLVDEAIARERLGKKKPKRR